MVHIAIYVHMTLISIMCGCVGSRVRALLKKGAQGSVLMCCIFPLLTERKTIYGVIDVFVFLPFTREKKKGTDIDVSSWDN